LTVEADTYIQVVVGAGEPLSKQSSVTPQKTGILDYTAAKASASKFSEVNLSLCFIRRHFIKNLGRVTTAPHVIDGLIAAEKRAISVKNRTLFFKFIVRHWTA
jgi:hypothetical protein